MTPTIEALLRIQDFDCRIMRLRQELADIPQRKKETEARLDRDRQAVVNAKDKLKTVQAAIHQLEGEIETYKAQIRKFREQQLQLKSNKEFKAMESEIENVGGSIKSVEEKILERMEELELVQGEVKAAEVNLAEETTSLKMDLQVMDQSAGKINVEVTALETERAALATNCDPVWLKHYDRIFQNRKDKAIVPVENTSCGGCHMVLPPYQVHDARKQTDIVNCGYCGRIIFDG